MTTAIWSDRLNTGIELIDAQHKLLFDTLNRLSVSLEGGGRNAHQEEDLAFLAQTTIRHFQTEETLMKEVGFPARSAHSDQHKDLILKVRALQYQQTKGQPVPRDVAAFLVAWFDHHITEADMDYVAYMKAGGRA